MLSALKKDPFRLFFPIGWISSIYGAWLWVSLKVGWTTGFPAEQHSQIMVGGFLLCFIMGFLMTAVPKFTSTEPANFFELLLSTSIVCSLLWNGFTAETFNLNLSILFGLLFIVFFAIRRFIKRKNNPPDTFIFIGLALVLGITGISLILSSTEIMFGRALLFQGMVLSLVLGVGGRLVPGILGWTEIVMTQRDRYENSESFFKMVPKINYFGVILFASSFVVEYFLFAELGRVLRAVVVSYIALKYWKLLSLPKKKTVHTFLLWTSCWSIFLGSCIYCVFPSVNTLHLFYIGGFGLMTYMVASRVTLAHGGSGLDLEAKIFPLSVVGFCILLAGVTRVSVFIVPDSYFNHLAYSAMVWILGLVIWGLIFIPKMFKRF